MLKVGALHSPSGQAGMCEMAKHKIRSREALSWLNKAFLQADSSPWAASLCVGPKQTDTEGWGGGMAGA